MPNFINLPHCNSHGRRTSLLIWNIHVPGLTAHGVDIFTHAIFSYETFTKKVQTLKQSIRPPPVPGRNRLTEALSHKQTFCNCPNSLLIAQFSPLSPEMPWASHASILFFFFFELLFLFLWQGLTQLPRLAFNLRSSCLNLPSADTRAWIC